MNRTVYACTVCLFVGAGIGQSGHHEQPKVHTVVVPAPEKSPEVHIEYQSKPLPEACFRLLEDLKGQLDQGGVQLRTAAGLTLIIDQATTAIVMKDFHRTNELMSDLKKLKDPLDAAVVESEIISMRAVTHLRDCQKGLD